MFVSVIASHKPKPHWLSLSIASQPGQQPQTHLLITGVLDAGALPFDGGIRSSQEAKCLLSLPPLALWQQEPGRLWHEAHADHHQRRRDGAADRQPAPVQEETCRMRWQYSEWEAEISAQQFLDYQSSCRLISGCLIKWTVVSALSRTDSFYTSITQQYVTQI